MIYDNLSSVISTYILKLCEGGKNNIHNFVYQNWERRVDDYLLIGTV